MAKLLSYYRLCPLIDIKNLLGISEDSEKGTVIVTLGKNIVIKYRLSDQKQIDSWRSKEKFSSAVLFNRKQEKYVAVFNHSFVRLWLDENDNLDKIKKYKFTQQIQTIIPHNEETFIVFKSGSVYPLSEILETRKTFTPAIIIEDTDILDVLYTSLNEDLYFGFLIKIDDIFTFYWTSYTQYSNNSFTKIKLFREGVTLSGYVLYSERNLVHLLTVWSDGKIYSKILKQSNNELTDPGELFTVLENISAQHQVKIIALNDNYIAIYGSDPKEEGAVLLIYNTQFKVTQTKQIHKLYSNEAKIWRTYNSILLPIGQNLIVVPFCLETEQLAALVGSHKPLDYKIDSDIAFVTDFEVASWQDDSNKKKKNRKKTSLVEGKEGGSSRKKNTKSICQFKGKAVPNGLKSRVKEFLKQGQTEALILEQILPEIIEDNNVELLEEILNFFTDIPEKLLAKILKFILSCDKKKFSSQNTREKFNNLSKNLLPVARLTIIDRILTRDYSDILLLPHLRSELSIEEAIFLLNYLNYQLSEDGHNLPSSNAVWTERRILNWACLIIDSNYQKFVLSKDEKIEQVLMATKTVVFEHLEVLEGLKTVVPVLRRIDEEIKGKSYGGGGLANTLYSVEQISLY